MLASSVAALPESISGGPGNGFLTQMANRDNERKCAVALEYDKVVDDAPRIVASGRGPLADQILEIAFAHGVKVREDADLVELLATLDVDSVVPLEAFAPVAEIIAYLYRINGQTAPAGRFGDLVEDYRNGVTVPVPRPPDPDPSPVDPAPKPAGKIAEPNDI